MNGRVSEERGKTIGVTKWVLCEVRLLIASDAPGRLDSEGLRQRMSTRQSLREAGARANRAVRMEMCGGPTERERKGFLTKARKNTR